MAFDKVAFNNIFANIPEKTMSYAEIAREIVRSPKRYDNFMKLKRSYERATKDLDLRYSDGTVIPEFKTLQDITYLQKQANQKAWLAEFGLVHVDDKSKENRKLMYTMYNLKIMVDRYNAMIDQTNRGFFGNERTKIAPLSTGYVQQRLQWAQEDNRLHNISMEYRESKYGLDINTSKKYIKYITSNGTSSRRLLPEFGGSKILLWYYNTRKAVWSVDPTTGELLDWIALHHPNKLYDALKILDDADKVGQSYLKAYHESKTFFKKNVNNADGSFIVNMGYLTLIDELFGGKDPRRGLNSVMEDVEINTDDGVKKYHILSEALR